MSQVAENIVQLMREIEKSAQCVGRFSSDVQLVAVSKRQPAAKIAEALEAGQRCFGENKVQEALEHWQGLKADYADLSLHLIGPLQTNKVKDAVALFDVIETVDRPKLVKELASEMKKQNRFLPCFVQVNTGAEDQKAGVAVEDLSDLLQLCGDEGLEVTGLMCIPPVDEPAALHFALLSKLAKRHGLENLSMGMSGDFEKAIALGATYIRIGTALFGSRMA